MGCLYHLVPLEVAKGSVFVGQLQIHAGGEQKLVREVSCRCGIGHSIQVARGLGRRRVARGVLIDAESLLVKRLIDEGSGIDRVGNVRRVWGKHSAGCWQHDPQTFIVDKEEQAVLDNRTSEPCRKLVDVIEAPGGQGWSLVAEVVVRVEDAAVPLVDGVAVELVRSR